MRTPYDAAGLAAALAALPAWSGDTSRISRTVHLPPEQDARLRAEVARVADEVDHHPVVEDAEGGGTRFVLWTHSRGAVTEQDVRLAARIDALVPQVGAQVAALLSGPPPYGDVPPPAPPDGCLVLPAPERFGLDATARSTGGVALPPSSYDGVRLHRVLPGGTVCVDAALRVTWSGAPADPGGTVATVLGLGDDLRELWEGCAQVPALAWVPAAGAGRVLRAPTVWEDLVGLLAATGTSFRSARASLVRLVGGGPFPAPDDVARRGQDGLRACGFGYRSGALDRLARDVADGRLDPQAWHRLPDDEVGARVTDLPGFGPFSAASLLPLLGRPRPLVLDRWLRSCLPGLSDDDLRARYAPLGRWAGTGLWLEVGGRWLRQRRALPG